MASNNSARQEDGRQAIAESRMFEMENHCPDSFEIMNQLRKDGRLCDISFKIGGHTFIAHRVVLASVSPYLRAMFTCGMRESSQHEIELRDIEPQAMAALIEYAYTGKVLVTIENVQDLLPAAGILQLKELKMACSTFLSDHMDTTNCLGIKQFADLHSCPELVKKANRFIVHKFMDIVKQEEFLQLPHQVLKELLNNDHLHVNHELQVLEALMHWVNHDLENRAPNCFELLEAVRIPLLPKEYWEELFNREPLFQRSQECRVFMKGYLMGLNFGTVLSQTTPRQPVQTVYTVGGRNSQHCLSSAERYVPEEDRWEELPNMLQVRTAVAVGALEGKLYAVGGECETSNSQEGTLYLNTVEYYDPIHNTWTAVGEMKHPRSFTAVAVMNGKLYSIGGECTSKSYKSVEEYDPASNAWIQLPDMHIARSGAGAVALGGKIYVIGGQDRTMQHSTMECYDPQERMWHLCANMRHPRSGVTAVVLSGCIYAIGGRDRHRQAYYDIVERYIPETNCWEGFHSLTHARAWPSATVYKGQIYVMGGYDGQFRLRTVERFDPEEQKWKRIADTSEYRAGCGSAVL